MEVIVSKLFVLATVLILNVSAYSDDLLSRGNWPFSAPSVTDGALISSKATGDIIFNTTQSKFYGWNGTSWVEFGGGANTALSNLGSTAINADLLPASAFSANIGSQFKGFANVWSKRFQGTDNSGSNRFTVVADTFTMPSGVNVDTTFYAQGNFSLGLTTASNQTANATATKAIRIEIGNKEAGTGDSGGIVLQTGTSVGGARGKLLFVDGSEGVIGQVWTSTDSSGGGEWSESTSPEGTLCGWNDGTLILNCKGLDPASSCPSNYTQRTNAVGANFCSAN